MSYDIAAFDVQVAPRGTQEFLVWYAHLMDETEPSGIETDSPVGRWAVAMQSEYPDAELADDGEGPVADYSSSFRSLVYVAASWTDEDAIRSASLRYARTMGVGVFTLSDDVPVLWWPDGSGGLDPVAEFR